MLVGAANSDSFVATVCLVVVRADKSKHTGTGTGTSRVSTCHSFALPGLTDLSAVAVVCVVHALCCTGHCGQNRDGFGTGTTSGRLE